MDSRLRGNDGLCKGLRTRAREMPVRGLSRTAAPAVFARSDGQYINGIIRIDRILNAERPKSSLAVAESYPFQVLFPFDRIGCNCLEMASNVPPRFTVSTFNKPTGFRCYDTYTVGKVGCHLQTEICPQLFPRGTLATLDTLFGCKECS